MTNVYTVKNVRTFRGSEGEGFNATLCLNGKPVADVDDAADGGCYRYHWTAKDRDQARRDEAAFMAHAKAAHPDMVEPDDMFVSALVEEISIGKQVARWTKSSVAFIIGRDIRRSKDKPTDVLLAHFAKAYPQAVILNGRPLSEAVALVRAVSA